MTEYLRGEVLEGRGKQAVVDAVVRCPPPLSAEAPMHWPLTTVSESFSGSHSQTELPIRVHTPFLGLVPRHSGTSVLVVNSFWNLWWGPKPTSTEWWGIFSCRAVSWLTQVLASATTNVWWVPSNRQVLKHFFYGQNATSTGFDGFWSLPRYGCM